ncbi:MFS transporter [Streptomyces sp. NEAU-W12]|uniref:MFS transporter n=1 Tax=Streptomyces sp. NEAU-W12 TaxID=2994668 RepID=UPI00224AD7ED|nr:MFS transporter [Streptomyces sp. NEAU-W12]MCX2926643.1 MFS transporter [Streptomyces sp. NEAU-W12]
MSVPIGGWAARVPEVRRQVGADETLWGLANTVPSIGNIVGLCTIVLLVGRVSNVVLASSGACLVLLTVPLMAASPSFGAVVLGLTTWALVAHIMDIPMGAMALEVQRRYGRPVMGSFDACFGLGTLAGGATGTAAAAFGVPPWVQFTVSSGLLGLCLAAVVRWLPEEAPHSAKAARVPLRRRFNRRMLPIAVMAFLTGYVTESSILWSAIYVTDTMGGGPVLGGATYTAAATAGTVAMLFVDRATARLGAVRVVRLSTLFAAAGFGLCLVLANPVAAIIGFIVLSVGMACVNPNVYTFAGNQEGLTASEGVSVVEIGQMPGATVAAPALIGVMSGAVGLRAALGSIVIATILLAALVGRVRYVDRSAGRPPGEVVGSPR